MWPILFDLKICSVLAGPGSASKNPSMLKSNKLEPANQQRLDNFNTATAPKRTIVEAGDEIPLGGRSRDRGHFGCENHLKAR